jgi:anti-anti-sigma factor
MIIEFALREIMNNAVEHGNKMDINKNIEYEINISEDSIIFGVSDEGDGFNLNETIKSIKQEKIDRKRRRGLILLIGIGFKICVNKGNVCAKLNYNKELGDCDMEFSFEENVIICNIESDFIAENIKKTSDKIHNIIKNNEFEKLIINMQNSKTIDSMGITILIEMHKYLEEHGKTLILTNANDSIKRLFKIIKLDSLFNI